jgi:lipopolysaccharide/colanic/teichoic acid biosynthesis glycosyltransferase/nucleoside-diphosphate-sugar epimerase
MITKRIFDLLLAVVLAVPASIICCFACFVIYVEIRASPIFRQTRVGRDNLPFKIFKLRTMKPDTADVASHQVTQSQMTRTGAWLRRLKFDELPQLFNVLNGTMSFVGPRPCLPSQHELVAQRMSRGVTSLLPGITGFGQLAGLDMSTPQKLAIADATYIGAWSLKRDLVILFQTASGGGRGDAALKHQNIPKASEQAPAEGSAAETGDQLRFDQTIVITGATGFLGRAVIHTFILEGWSVVALVRNPHGGFASEVQQICLGDLAHADPKELASAMRGADCLIHLAAVVPGKNASTQNGTVQIAKAVCEAASCARVPRMIVLSSVYAALAEQGDPNARIYGYEKLSADRAIAQAGSDVTRIVTLRPPVVYGLGMTGALAKLVKIVGAGLPLPFGLAKNQRHYISRKNLVDLISTIARAPDVSWQKANGQYYVPTDGLALSTAGLVRMIAQANGRTPRLVPVPLSLLRLVGGVSGFSEMLSGAIDPLAHNDNAALLSDFEWAPIEEMPKSLAELLGGSLTD